MYKLFNHTSRSSLSFPPIGTKCVSLRCPFMCAARLNALLHLGALNVFCGDSLRSVIQGLSIPPTFADLASRRCPSNCNPRPLSSTLRDAPVYANCLNALQIYVPLDGHAHCVLLTGISLLCCSILKEEFLSFLWGCCMIGRINEFESAASCWGFFWFFSFGMHNHSISFGFLYIRSVIMSKKKKKIKQQPTNRRRTVFHWLF